MKRQPHLIVSPDPLKPGENYQALCGKEIEQAVWVWQVVERGEAVDRLKTCPKCWGRLISGESSEPVKYVYGAISARDAQAETEEVA